MSSAPTYVFIHGGSSNAKAWVPLQQELALRGHRSLAVDLPGHGLQAPHHPGYHGSPQDLDDFARTPSHMAKVTLADNVAHVMAAARRLTAFGPVVLVSSSMGGLTATGVANEAPELVARNVYVSAAVPIAGLDLTDPADAVDVLLDAAVVPLVMADPLELGAARLNWRLAFHDRDVFAPLKEAIMADATDDQFAALIATFDPDEIFVTPTQAGDELSAEDAASASAEPVATIEVNPSRWGLAPHTFVRLTADRCISLRQQDAMIAAADKLTPDHPFDVRTVDTSHVGYFVRPALFAEMLIDLASD